MEEFKKDTVLYSPGDDINNLYLILSGSVTAYTTYGRFTYGPGCVVGLIDGYYGISMYTYVVSEDCNTLVYRFSDINDISGLIDTSDEKNSLLLSSALKISMTMLKTYLSLNMRCRKSDPASMPDIKVERWELDKYNALCGMPIQIRDGFYLSNPAFLTAELIGIAKFCSSLNDCCLQLADVLGINHDYVPPKPEPEVIAQYHIENDQGYVDEEIIAELRNSFNKIVEYAQLEHESYELITRQMTAFKKLKEPLSMADDVYALRKSLTDSFYELYYHVFIRSLSDEHIPGCVRMFLNFGYIDETLLMDSTIISLYKINQEIEAVCNNSHVYTMYNWLKQIYWGDKQPSKNSLEQGFDDYLRELSRKNTGFDAKAALEDNDMKLKYEIKNMFRSTHRMTYGKVSSFVPFLIDENMGKSVEGMLITAEIIMKNINKVRAIDFSLFFRSSIYSDESLGIGKETIYNEVLPDIILTPCAGTYGVMWQEIEGRARNTSGRFVFPILCNGRFDSLLLNVLGKFRWELCKRIQGAYWNNISEKSLTSEYYDYLQFYKKNHDLSEAARSKIKSTLISCRNNFSEFFARDYEQWIAYESSGSSKLNKITRIIMAKYCPFNKDIRAELSGNPSYSKAFEIFEKNRMSQCRRIDLLIRTLQAKDIPIPKEIRETKAYLNR